MSNPRLWFLAPPSLFAALVLILSSFAPSARAAGDVNTSVCPSETESSPGFHSYMPDCRAYELVTPPYVNGANSAGIGNKDEPPQISADGNHVLGKVIGGLAETEAAEQNNYALGSYYEFSRTPAGWTTEAITPPDSLFPRSEFEGASADFTRSLWAGQLPPKPGEELPGGTPPNGTPGQITGFNYPNNAVLAIREPAGAGKGRFTIVGPVAAPGHQESEKGVLYFNVEGASSDLSHILLRVSAVSKQLWPGDGTLAGDESLYEYVGTGDREPVLVGVSNEVSVAEAAARGGKAYVNEAAELISRCGIGLGGYGASGTLANAVSESGERTFFTALACSENPGEPKVNELYARVGGRSTVDISEPTTGPGGDCAACLPESEPYSAVYQGAAGDGSKVFFTTEQELLPGADGNSLYEYNFDAANPHERLTLIAAQVSGVPAISQDGTRVYFESPAVLTGQANGNGETARAGGQNLYLYDTDEGTPGFVGKPVFVAQEPDASTQVETIEPRTTRDGQYLVFTTARHILGTDDTSAIPEIFEYDAETGRIGRVSVGQSVPGGAECPATHLVEERYGCDGNATSGSYYLPYSLIEQEAQDWLPTDATSGLAVAADGTVEFESQIALTPLAVPGKENVYEYESGQVYLLSPGNEPVSPIDVEGGVPASRALGVDESGQDAFFSTTASLVPQDTDSQTSWYDAREDGGYPAPVEPPSCTAGTCQGAGPATPSLQVPLAPPSVNENAVPPKPVGTKPLAKPKAKSCKKGTYLKKSKCVPRPKSKKAKKASTNRGRTS